MSQERWVTFDCYGTLIDWDRGMTSVIRHLAGQKTEDVLTSYHDLEPVVQQEWPFRRYRDVLAETLRRAAARENWRWREAGSRCWRRHCQSGRSLPMSPSPLTPSGKRAGSLAILSNVDRELTEGTLERLPVPFDRVVTAEDVRSYKPALAHWHLFQPESGVQLQNWVHVASSYFHDILPARELGIRSIWINRTREPRDAAAATRVLHTLNELPKALESMAGS